MNTIKIGNRIKNKQTRSYGWLHTVVDENKIALDIIDNDTCRCIIDDANKYEVAECAENPEVKCNYEGKNMHGLNCAICSLKKHGANINLPQ